MPSFTTLLTASALVVSHLAAASPAPFVPFGPRSWGRPTPVGDLKLPTTGGDPPLPTTAFTLKYVALGRGIQNYTCASVGAKPASAGAIATLYDATVIAQWSLDMLNIIPGIAVNDAPPAAGKDYTLPPPVNRLSVLGHHYFAADGTPTFDLKPVKKLLYSTKNGGTTAPSDAPKGPSGTDAVDWLSLIAKTDYDASVGLSQVYRVETAGGKADPECSSTDMMTVQYSAEYWFYG